ncbi:nucleotidyltransferase [Desulfosarcina widdelii]|uniref:glucose-1-phosphate thymidylyltransferase n=1 Tax=Desulfosarcina widdelii TaxID=947919 RepID=A0A5K7ZA57_9BACT|nr:sugar phosphate nucleotidyltransferase [Desulfosarcina widdelii]BBO77670.1 nucleotidyltransferase [Desulfosarcina widdelii]
MVKIRGALRNELIGLLPAAGKASRIQPLPCSKELLPVGLQALGTGQGEDALRPKAISQYLLESMVRAGAGKAFIVINREKWDIPAYFGPGRLTGADLAYVVTDCPYGAPFSLRQAFPFVRDATVLFGFPDIRFTPVNAFSRLLEKQSASGADLVMGLYRASDPSKMDMVRLDRNGGIQGIDIKPAATTLTFTWIIAVWSPTFTRFMQRALDDAEPLVAEEYNAVPKGRRREYYVGNVIQTALDSGLNVASVIFDEGRYIDIGTPESLVAAMTQITAEKEKR